MGHFILIFCSVFAFISRSTAHFLLNYPPTIGFDDSLEATPPCGSFSIDFSKDNVTNFSIGGDSVAVTSIHPKATWLFRATLNQNAAGNWTDLLPAIVQTGLGDYCEQNIMVPSSFAGSKGVLQVVQDAPDGILYQCAAVKFVSGVNGPLSICKNVTGLTASYTTDPTLSSLPTGTTAPTGSAATSTSSSTSSSIASAALSVDFYRGLSVFLWLGMIAAETLVVNLV